MKIPGSMNPYYSYLFLKDPVSFCKKMQKQFGDLYYFNLAWKQVYFTSNPDLTEKISQLKSIELFEAKIIEDVLGDSLFTRPSSSEQIILRSKFHDATSQLDFSLLDNYKLRITSSNGYCIIEQLILDWMSILFLGTNEQKKYFELRNCLKEFFDNLTTLIMFVPEYRKTFGIFQWLKFLNCKEKLIKEISLSKFFPESVFRKFLISGFNKHEAINHSILFLFASFDNLIAAICNDFILKKNSLREFPPIPVIPKKILEPIYFKDYIFPSGTSISILPCITKLNIFGTASRNCLGIKNSIYLLAKAKTLLNDSPLSLAGDVKYSRIRFSWVPSYFIVK